MKEDDNYKFTIASLQLYFIVLRIQKVLDSNSNPNYLSDFLDKCFKSENERNFNDFNINDMLKMLEKIRPIQFRQYFIDNFSFIEDIDLDRCTYYDLFDLFCDTLELQFNKQGDCIGKNTFSRNTFLRYYFDQIFRDFSYLSDFTGFEPIKQKISQNRGERSWNRIIDIDFVKSINDKISNSTIVKQISKNETSDIQVKTIVKEHLVQIKSIYYEKKIQLELEIKRNDSINEFDV